MNNRASSHERAHRQAKQRDAREAYNVGDDPSVVIEENPAMNNGRQPVTHVGNLVVFVHPGEASLDAGTHIRVRVTHFDRNHLQVVAMERLDV